ncbi:MAG: enoyl-CoA hydratase/isomerase family protein [Ilumatobacteraceae bacterium]
MTADPQSNETSDSTNDISATVYWHVDRSDHIAILRYDGGSRRTMNIAGAGQLAALLADFARRPEPPVLVLALDVLHAELSEVREMSNGRPIADWAPWLAAIQGVENYTNAVIVSVADQATCGGLELAVAADIRVAAPSARLGVLETRIGLVPGAGGTQRLPELIGFGNASLLVLTGESVSGTEALRMGLVQLVDTDPLGRSVELAEGIARNQCHVTAAAKRALQAGRVRSPDGFRVEGRSFLAVVGSDSSKQRIDLWLESQAAGHNPALRSSPLP